MNSDLTIVKTADGSNTVYNARVRENYHSKHGALQESMHVFVKSGLQFFLDRPGEVNDVVSILEVGFGTGLNFLLSADVCDRRRVKLNYTGIEAYPLSEELISHTGYDQYISAQLWKKFIPLYPAALTGEVSLNKNCSLQVVECPLINFQSPIKYDIIYFDAFAAAYQPEMWDKTAINHTMQYLKPGGIFVTYAITGNLKRLLNALGCKVEKAPGAPGKREMLRATGDS